VIIGPQPVIHAGSALLLEDVNTSGFRVHGKKHPGLGLRVQKFGEGGKRRERREREEEGIVLSCRDCIVLLKEGTEERGRGGGQQREGEQTQARVRGRR
jgi:hypothetical protein